MCLPNKCPRCGYQQPSNDTPDQPPKPSESSQEPRNDIETIHRRAQQLEVVIQQLKQEQIDLLRKLNEAQSSTRTLPVEILSTIFSFACPRQKNTTGVSGANTHFQVILGAVSSHWRQVVWSTPKLWTKVILIVRPSTVHLNATLLALYLRNSARFSVTLDVVFTVEYKPGIGHSESSKRFLERLDAFRDLLFAIPCGKVDSLKLDGMPYDWMPRLPSSFHRVRSLLLGWWPGQRLGPAANLETITLSRFSRLQKLTIKRVMPQIALPWNQITSLTCHRLPIDVCIHLLVLCPNLTIYRSQHSITPTASNPFHLDDDVVSSADKRVTLHHLSHLEWSHYPSSVCQKLQNIELPSLQILQWSDDGYNQTALDAFCALLSHAPSLVSLALNGKMAPTVMQEAAKWKDIFTTHTPNLTRLRLRSISFSLFEILNPGSTLNRGYPQGTLVLPNLEDLYLSGKFDTGLARSHGLPIVQMLEGRRELSSNLGRFFLGTLQRVEWQPEVQERLLRLGRSGLKLEIVENSTRVDWLRF